MRSRLLTVVLSLVVLVLLGLGIPLALDLAASSRQRMFLDRITMTARLASLAQRPLLDGRIDAFGQTLQRYQDVYGFSAIVLDREARPTARTAAQPRLDDPDVSPHVDDALAGRSPGQPESLLPWQDRPMVVAEPVMVEGQVRGAVVTVSPTGPLREQVLIRWAAVLLGGVLALGLAVLLALPVVRWILRPVRRLEAATREVAETVTGSAPLAASQVRSGPPELRELARSFDRMTNSVGEAFAAQRAFVADASHQLRNPLTALHIRLSSLDGMVAEEAVDDHTAAVAESRRLSQVLDELLALARAESGSGTAVVLDASAVLHERIQAWRAVAATRQVELRPNAGDGLRVFAVARTVETVLDALLDNAIKFGAGHPVDVTADRDGDRVVLVVRDHGPGLDPADLERVTDRFWRSAEQQNTAGSGLGMAIVRRVVERSGGGVRLDLPDGGGLRVSVHLPAA